MDSPQEPSIPQVISISPEMLDELLLAVQMLRDELLTASLLLRDHLFEIDDASREQSRETAEALIRQCKPD